MACVERTELVALSFASLPRPPTPSVSRVPWSLSSEAVTACTPFDVWLQSPEALPINDSHALRSPSVCLQQPQLPQMWRAAVGAVVAQTLPCAADRHRVADLVVQTVLLSPLVAVMTRKTAAAAEEEATLLESGSGEAAGAAEEGRSSCGWCLALYLVLLSTVSSLLLAAVIWLLLDLRQTERDITQPTQYADLSLSPPSDAVAALQHWTDQSQQRPQLVSRYLLVLGLQERLGNAVISLAELLDWSAAGNVSVVAPSVVDGGIGRYSRDGTPVTGADQPFSAYFDIQALQRSGIPIVDLPTFAKAAPPVLTTAALLPVDLLLYVAFRPLPIQFNASGLSDCASYAFDSGIGLRRADVAFAGLSVRRIACFNASHDLRSTLDALYSGMSATASPAARTIALYNYHKSKRSYASASLDAMFDAINPRFGRVIAAQPWANSFAVIQMRAGYYLRICPDKACRSQSGELMRQCAAMLINETRIAMAQQGLQAVLIAADVYGTLPEAWPGEPDVVAAFNSVAAMFAAAFPGQLRSIALSEVEAASADPIGASTLLDFELAVRANLLAMMSRRIDGAFLSEFSNKIHETRVRRNKTTHKVFCFS